MNSWRQKAEQMFPELQSSLEIADTPYLLWYELQRIFEQAYDQENASIIGRIYEYAKWCGQQPRGKTAEDDLLTCVTVSFYEHIPQHPKALEDMPRWFTQQEVETMKEVFSYYVGPDGFDRILAQFKKLRKR